MNKANILRLTVAFATLVTVIIASGQGRPGAVKAPQVPRAAPQVQYTVIDLGTDGVGNQITDSGRIVGSINFGGPDRDAAFWPTPQSPPIDLGTLPGFTGSRGFGVNPRGEIVGYALAAYPVLSARPLFWASTQSAPMELPGLPVGLAGLADAISPVGQIVGVFFALDFSVSQPVVWPRSNAAPIYLAELSETLRFGAAISINAVGNILGDGCDQDHVECHAAFWANSASAPVALASPGGEFIYTDVALTGGTVAPELNNAGSMVGFAYNPHFSATRAVFWASSSSPAVILSTAGEFTNGGAEGINDQRQIVGTAFNSDFSDAHAFLWASPTSQGIDLNTVIPPGSGWELIVARSINNRGEISGAGLLNGEQHAVALIPVHGSSANALR
jgi:probable HAF family extracellular repeat protein